MNTPFHHRHVAFLTVALFLFPSISLQAQQRLLPINRESITAAARTSTHTTDKPKTKTILRLDGSEQVTETFGQKDAKRFLAAGVGAGDTVDGNGAIHFGATSAAAEGSKYFGTMVFLSKPVDLRAHRLQFFARTNHPGTTAAFYVRVYNRGEKKPAWSFNSWNAQLTQTWREFTLQAGVSLSGLAWEPKVVENRVGATIDRIEFIIGTRQDNASVDILIDDVRIGAELGFIKDLQMPYTCPTDTVLVQDGQAVVTILHPDSANGRKAAAAVAASIAKRTGAQPRTRVGTETDRIPTAATILLGNVNNNPAMQLLYARYLTPADSVCPGTGGALVQTVCDPFGKGVNVIVAAASDEAGLIRAADVLIAAIGRQPASKTLVLPDLFEKQYGASFLKRFGWADDAPAADRLERGLQQGRQALERGTHQSVAGVLASVAERYMLTGHHGEAKLFVKLWDLYAKSAHADPRKYGGPWGFDSDFAAARVVTGWDVIEHDSALSDDDRLRTTKNMGRWLAEAVIPKCAGAATSTRVLHNHQTFPGLGALFAGLYYSQHYDLIEGRTWLEIADTMFRRQAGYYKPTEDCNGYQWLTNGHLMRYSLARPDFTLFENGNGSRIIDYCIGTMDNLGYQVPYGDTGSWQCWNSEMICLDMYAFATGSPEARWAANRKRSLKNTIETHAFYQLEPGKRPDRFNGVMVWPLEPQYYATHGATKRPPLSRCFDKISFRASMEPQAAYLLLDGLSNGGHKHLDGNSLPRLTLFDRIWLADNDYYKAPVKFHNSVTVFQDGQSKLIPPYVELVGTGESERFGYSRTQLTDYAGVDWDRTVVWLKGDQAFVILDRLTARSDDEYQFRTLWHGVGDATLDDSGLLLTQQGPSLRIQVAPGPDLRLREDAELGANWRGYPYAEPIVHSLQGVATARLKQGETYLFASVLHGDRDGIAPPWEIRFLAHADGIKLSTNGERLSIVLGPCPGSPAKSRITTDAQCFIVSDAGLSLFDATRAQVGGNNLFESTEAEHVDIAWPEAADWLKQAPLRQPAANLEFATDAPKHHAEWCVTPVSKPSSGPSRKSTPQRFSRLANASLRKAGQPDTILAATIAGTLFALNTDGSTRWSLKTGSQLNDVTAADLTGDGTDEIILARQDYKVQVLDGTGQPVWTRTLSFYRRPPAVNLVRTGDIDGDGKLEVIVGGENWRFYAFDSDGTELWNYESVHPSRAGAVADLDGDGKAEVICGTHYYWATALNSDGTARWKYSFGPICYDIAIGHFDRGKSRGVIFGSGDGKVHYVDANGKPRRVYDTGDEVKHVVAADLDGDGLDEILAGSLNDSVYCFGAAGKRRWRLDLGSPISALVTVPQRGGRLVVVGTASGRLATVDSTGRVQALTELKSEITDILICGNMFVVATTDGQLRRFTGGLDIEVRPGRLSGR